MNNPEAFYCAAPVSREEVQRQFLELCRFGGYRSSLADFRSVLRCAYRSHCTRVAMVGAREHLIIRTALRALQGLLPRAGRKELAPDVGALLAAMLSDPRGRPVRAPLHVSRGQLLAFATTERLLSDAQEFGDRGDIDLLYSDDFGFLAHAFQIPL